MEFNTGQGISGEWIVYVLGLILGVSIGSTVFGCEEWEESLEVYVGEVRDDDGGCQQLGNTDICLLANGIDVDKEWLLGKFEDVVECAGVDADSVDDFVLELVDHKIQTDEGEVSGHIWNSYIRITVFALDEHPEYSWEESFAHEVGHYIEHRKSMWNDHSQWGLAINCGDMIDLAWALGLQDSYTPVPTSSYYGERPLLGRGMEYASLAYRGKK